MEIRVPHTLDRATAAQRIRAAIDRMDMAPTADDAQGGEFGGACSKDTPLGSVEARWEAAEGEVIVTVTRKPAWLSEGAVRKPLESGLQDALTRES